MNRNIYSPLLIQKAKELRLSGSTYNQIRKILNVNIAKSTLSGWFNGMELSTNAKQKIHQQMIYAGIPARLKSQATIKKKKAELISNIHLKAEVEISQMTTFQGKLFLSILYWAEGGKTNEFLSLGNSDPKLIELYLELLRSNFPIDENKFRGRVQCRADQDINSLQSFWSEISKIPLKQFGRVQIDKRTIGKVTKKKDYKGVFVVEYYSNQLLLELKAMSDIIYKRMVSGL